MIAAAKNFNERWAKADCLSFHLLVFVVYAEYTMETAPAKETFNKRDPAHNGDKLIGPAGIKQRSKRAEPPQR